MCNNLVKGSFLIDIFLLQFHHSLLDSVFWTHENTKSWHLELVTKTFKNETVHLSSLRCRTTSKPVVCTGVCTHLCGLLFMINSCATSQNDRGQPMLPLQVEHFFPRICHFKFFKFLQFCQSYLTVFSCDSLFIYDTMIRDTWSFSRKKVVCELNTKYRYMTL